MHTIYGQKDLPWGPEVLGTGTSTFAQVGCTVCSYAMCRADKGHPENPWDVNVQLKEKNGYANGNLLNWVQLNSCYPDTAWIERIDYRSVAADLQRIADHLAKGNSVIVEVSAKPIGGTAYHFMKVHSVDVSKGTVIVDDPWYKETADITAKHSIPGRAVRATTIITGIRVMRIEPKPQPQTSNNSDVPPELQKYGKGSMNDLVAYFDQLIIWLDEERKENDILRSQNEVYKQDTQDIYNHLPEEMEESKASVIARLDLCTRLEDQNVELQKRLEQEHQQYKRDLVEAEQKIATLKQAIEKLEVTVTELQKQAEKKQSEQLIQATAGLPETQMEKKASAFAKLVAGVIMSLKEFFQSWRSKS